MILRRIFSRRVGYAAHALCLLASRDPAAAFPLGELAQHMARSWPGTSASYLSKVLQALVHGGILVSLRGSAGGYGFARPPAELSLLDIVGALEGPQDADCPLTPKGPCLLRQRCGNHRILVELQLAVSSLLAEVPLARLASNLPQPELPAATPPPPLALFPRTPPAPPACLPFASGVSH